MSKWKCDICNSEFNNYHAEGFNNKIYCPLCYYKHEYNDLKQQLSQLQQEKEELIKHCENEIYNQKESIELLSNKKYADIHIGAINAYKNVLSKLKESDK